MRQKNRDDIFEHMPIPSAVASLCLPTVLSSLIMACYSLADTFFVGMINDPVQNAAVTLASPALMMFVFILLRKRGQTHVCVHPKYFRPSVNRIGEMCAVGVPAMISKLLTISSQIVLNNALAHYGAQAVAAMGIAFRIDVLPLDVCIGISQGIMPLIGYNYGSGNTSRMKEAWLFTVKTATVVMVSVMTLYLLIPETLVGLFIQNRPVIQIGAGLLRGMCLALPFYGFTSIAIGVFQACGMGGSSLLIALCRQVVLMIPSILLLDWAFGLYGIAYSYLVSEVILVTVSVFLLRRLFRGFENNHFSPIDK